jgi:hypothetical protein
MNDLNPTSQEPTCPPGPRMIYGISEVRVDNLRAALLKNSRAGQIVIQVVKDDFHLKNVTHWIRPHMDDNDNPQGGDGNCYADINWSRVSWSDVHIVDLIKSADHAASFKGGRSTRRRDSLCR